MRSLSAYSTPSSTSGSHSARPIQAGATPSTSGASSGAKRQSSRSAGLLRDWAKNQVMAGSAITSPGAKRRGGAGGLVALVAGEVRRWRGRSGEGRGGEEGGCRGGAESLKKKKKEA